MKQKRGLEWRDAAEDFLGDVYPTGHSGGYGLAAGVGACGHDSDWHCELVVCVSDGLVWVGRTAKPKERCRAEARRYESNIADNFESQQHVRYAIGNLVKIPRTGTRCVVYCVCA